MCRQQGPLSCRMRDPCVYNSQKREDISNDWTHIRDHYQIASVSSKGDDCTMPHNLVWDTEPNADFNKNKTSSCTNVVATGDEVLVERAYALRRPTTCLLNNGISVCAPRLLEVLPGRESCRTARSRPESKARQYKYERSFGSTYYFVSSPIKCSPGGRGVSGCMTASFEA